MKDIIKNIRKLVLENKKEEALKLLPRAYKLIDKASKTGIIKKNNANRKKSRLTRLVNKEVPSASAKASADEPKGSQ